MMQRTAIAFALALSLTAPAVANGLSASQSVTKQVTRVDEHGEIEVREIAADSVSPGDTIIYTLYYAYDGKTPATDIVLTMPVPEEVLPLADSLYHANTTALYSDDQGLTYLALPDANSHEPDTHLILSQITHLRWALHGDTDPGTIGSISFSGQVR